MRSLIDDIEDLLREFPDASPRADAERIVQAALDGGDLDARDRAIEMAKARMNGVPLGYVIGKQTFMGLELIAAPGALVPREETELLGYTTLQLMRDMKYEEPIIIDMCCGSGNLACGLAHHFPRARVWASDLTDGCVSVARRNVQHFGLGDRVTVVQGDLFAGLETAGLLGRADIIVCNPPYISEKRLSGDGVHLLKHEPREAFSAGPYGLSIHQRVLKEALPFLKDDGFLLFEIGLGQDKQITNLFDRTHAYDEFHLISNQAGEPRVAVGRKKKAL